MKIGLFGGSFDPIHRGHLEPVRQARALLGLDRVIYLPTAKPPHKPERKFAPPHARYAMVELALLYEHGLFASPHELTPERPSYTVETLEHFTREMPEAELHLLIGADSFLGLPNWVRFRDILSLARLVVLARPGWEIDPRGVPAELEDFLGSDRLTVLAQEEVSVSSTRLRELLSRDEPIPAGWLPDLVLDYIAKYRLYR